MRPSNGEVEGPDHHAGRATRAHNFPRRPRRQADRASRPPPTIVRRRRACHGVSPFKQKRDAGSGANKCPDDPWRNTEDACV